MKIKGLNFVRITEACPEQYDVFSKTGVKVGYVRLRFGNLRCDYPDVGGETIYQMMFDDEWMGIFESKDQKMKYLNDIADTINKRLNKVPA